MTSSKFTTFSEKVAELAEQLAGVAPPEVLEVFAADQRELQAAGVPASVAVPGTRFPIAELIGADGTSVSSADVLAGAPTVVVFYRGAWGPDAIAFTRMPVEASSSAQQRVRCSTAALLAA